MDEMAAERQTTLCCHTTRATAAGHHTTLCRHVDDNQNRRYLNANFGPTWDFAPAEQLDAAASAARGTEKLTNELTGSASAPAHHDADMMQ